MLDHVEDHGHIGVNHARRIRGLLDEALDEARVGGRPIRDGLYGNVSIEAQVASTIHVSHSTASDHFEEAVPVQKVARSEIHNAAPYGPGIGDQDPSAEF